MNSQLFKEDNRSSFRFQLGCVQIMEMYKGYSSEATINSAAGQSKLVSDMVMGRNFQAKPTQMGELEVEQEPA